MVARGEWIRLAVFVLIFSGCALTDVHLKAPTSGLKTPIPGGSQRQIIVTIPFTDAREITARCGMQKGGYGNETASAVCQDDPARWIAEFLASELRASGFTVLPTEEGAHESALKIEGVLLKIFVEPVVGFWTTTVETDLNVRLVATSRIGLHAERAFFVKGEIESVIWTQGIFNDSLENGIRALLTKMVEAILELMKQYPAVGFEDHPLLRQVSWRAEAR